jgi:hypothetical protein
MKDGFFDSMDDGIERLGRLEPAWLVVLATISLIKRNYHTDPLRVSYRPLPRLRHPRKLALQHTHPDPSPEPAHP